MATDPRDVWKKTALGNAKFRAAHTVRSGKWVRREEPLAFELTLADLLTPDNCLYCGVVLVYDGTKRKGEPRDQAIASVDRILPARGYVRRNVLTICAGCNARKGDASPDEHRLFADVMTAFA